MIVKFFLPKGSVNDATEYYVSLIEVSLHKIGLETLRVNSPIDVKNDDFVVTITPVHAVILKILRRKLKFINWFQGVGPEEYLLLHGKLNLKARFISNALRLIEIYVLKSSELNIFVSKSMVDHYNTKYFITSGRPFVIIPCYNKKLRSESFHLEGKYATPKFVYAGGLYPWQCVEKTLKIFKLVEDNLPSAQLTILTQDVNKALKMISNHGISRASAKYVPMADLDFELESYKYGFLIRGDSVINNVATPTKMNTYLANGIIPIYSDVIRDFEDNIELGGYGVKIPNSAENHEAAQMIVEHSRKEIKGEEIYSRVRTIFENYYCDEKHIATLVLALSNINWDKGY